MREGCRLQVTRMSSARSSTMRTGRPVFSAATAAAVASTSG